MRRLDGLPKKSKYAPAEQRFAEGYIPEPNSGCWLWTRSLNEHGYGSFGLNGQWILAHRASLILSGRAQSGPYALHTCDTPSCVNPDHLFYGTQAENMADMVNKKRRASTRGEANPRNKLSEKQARQILTDARPASVIASELGVSSALVRLIKNRKCWTHLDGNHAA